MQHHWSQIPIQREGEKHFHSFNFLVPHHKFSFILSNKFKLLTRHSSGETLITSNTDMHVIYSNKKRGQNQRNFPQPCMPRSFLGYDITLKFKHDLVFWYIPSPQGDFLVVMWRTFVGILTGPFTLSRLSLAPRTRSAQTRN